MKKTHWKKNIEKGCLCKIIDIGTKENCNVWILVWLSKTKIWQKAKLCYIDTDSFITHVKTEGIYKDIAEHVGTRFDTSYYEIDRPLSVRKNKKLVGLMKDELGGEKSWKKMLDWKQRQIAI